ncbi:NYN domain-containing protein [Hydrogenophaga sp. BPS33]|uniref:NYN domain-containing protein n=1 Tax=Hydrogenophaga sp. BPS33 TaxID=2651974 RepID=UPI00131FC954|nr:NYN domain-containing protein [Hydrogenophaga sp. BPS33]QHE85720.1 NYN domain-containing protein [Hydrogenophaga sp. BPS33]
MTRLQHKQQRLAVLFDSANISYTLTRPILQRAANYGVLTVKRAYGDWSLPGMSRMRSVLLHNAIEPVQLFPYTKGKNAADIMLSLEAMELVNTGQFDGVCIASSDSDLTPLAYCIRREGLRVYGFGGRQTPRPFVAACDSFIYTESIATA